MLGTVWNNSKGMLKYVALESENSFGNSFQG